jgi:hypothetical protein
MSDKSEEISKCLLLIGKNSVAFARKVAMKPRKLRYFGQDWNRVLRNTLGVLALLGSIRPKVDDE